jgi:broad specificity phosphatase PhoE
VTKSRRVRPWAVAMGLVVTLAWPAAASAQKLVIVVRHAERADGGSGSMGSDPPLSAAGQARATRLATMLGDAGVKAVFATEYKRTQDTAKPLATKLGLAVQIVAAADTPKLIAKIKEAHARDVVVIVAHSNTMPDIIKAFGGPPTTIADDDYDNLFVIVPATGSTARLKWPQ